jgi:hypothetical protein
MGFGAMDAVAILLVILILSGSLGALLASRDVQFVARAQQWVRLAMDSLSLNVFLPNQASAEATPSKGRAAGS